MPISYCFGVTKAISKAIEIRKKYPDRNIVFFGDIVHNENVIDYFKELGIRIVSFNENNAFELLNSFVEEDIVIFSAHGHDRKYEEILNKKKITFFDTTCIKVKKNLSIIENSSDVIIYIGKEHHPETIASLSYSSNIFLYDVSKIGKFDFSLIKSDNPLIVNQTTLSFLELDEVFKDIKKNIKNPHFIDEICDASRLRQEKILKVDESFDLIVVVGDKKSSNTTKLYELSKNHNKNAETIMVNGLEDFSNYNLKKYKKAYIASGTSTPIDIIKEIEKYLEEI